jgi:RNA polymerase sigma-70 factor (ECF subfamily)
MFLEHKYTIDELIKRCRAGEHKAHELLYKQFASKMLGVCMRYAVDKMEAEDMLQNGFIKVFQKLGDYRGEGSFEGWVRRIMVHCAIEYYRKHHKVLQVVDFESVGPGASAEPVALARLDAKDLLALIQQLSPGYRMIFNLYAIEGYSHKEIALILGITEGSSKSQLSRARAILKEQITRTGEKRYENAG